ncbi:MAG: preprotein translocase subunit SecG [Pirellulales bacterium]|nr:preprotein translocase subunit SecG [Pirellulales bacterium]
MIAFFFKAILVFLALFLIVLVLLQRGRGGGLAGALGGMGGQSAFGSKAGDVFTRVTIVVAAIWIVLCAAAVKYFEPERKLAAPRGGAAAIGSTDTEEGEGTKPPSRRGRKQAPPAPQRQPSGAPSNQD